MAYGTVNVPPKEKEITVDSALSSTSTNPVQNKVVQAALALKAALNHVHTAATTTAAGFMSAADKVKLDGIAAGANKYTHPAYTAKSAGLYKVTVDSTGHVSAATAVAKTDITALGIPAQDTVYTHPTDSGYKHIPSGGSSGQILRWSADGTAVWGADNNTTYSNMKAATASAAGAAGLVPAPAAGAQAKFLRGDGTWQTPISSTFSDTLWTNSTPANGFAAQTISLNLTGYKAVIVIAKGHTSTDSDKYGSLIVPIGFSGQILMASAGATFNTSDSSTNMAFRDVKVTSNSLQFGTGFYRNLIGAFTESAEVCIPYKIIGMK